MAHRLPNLGGLDNAALRQIGSTLQLEGLDIEPTEGLPAYDFTRFVALIDSKWTRSSVHTLKLLQRDMTNMSPQVLTARVREIFEEFKQSPVFQCLCAEMAALKAVKPRGSLGIGALSDLYRFTRKSCHRKTYFYHGPNFELAARRFLPSQVVRGLRGGHWSSDVELANHVVPSDVLLAVFPTEDIWEVREQVKASYEVFVVPNFERLMNAGLARPEGNGTFMIYYSGFFRREKPIDPALLPSRCIDMGLYKVHYTGIEGSHKVKTLRAVDELFEDLLPNKIKHVAAPLLRTRQHFRVVETPKVDGSLRRLVVQGEDALLLSASSRATDSGTFFYQVLRKGIADTTKDFVVELELMAKDKTFVKLKLLRYGGMCLPFDLEDLEALNLKIAGSRVLDSTSEEVKRLPTDGLILHMSSDAMPYTQFYLKKVATHDLDEEGARNLGYETSFEGIREFTLQPELAELQARPEKTVSDTEADVVNKEEASATALLLGEANPERVSRLLALINLLKPPELSIFVGMKSSDPELIVLLDEALDWRTRRWLAGASVSGSYMVNISNEALNRAYEKRVVVKYGEKCTVNGNMVDVMVPPWFYHFLLSKIRFVVNPDTSLFISEPASLLAIRSFVFGKLKEKDLLRTFRHTTVHDMCSGTGALSLVFHVSRELDADPRGQAVQADCASYSYDPQVFYLMNGPWGSRAENIAQQKIRKGFMISSNCYSGWETAGATHSTPETCRSVYYHFRWEVQPLQDVWEPFEEDFDEGMFVDEPSDKQLLEAYALL